MARRSEDRRQYQPQFNINLNFEGGGERSVMDGDHVSEGLLNDIGFPSLPGLRSPMVESVFEYGSRVGGWRLLRLFRRFGIKVCLLAVAKAAERNPEITRACRGWPRDR